MLHTAFGASCRNRASVFEWHKRFKESRYLNVTVIPYVIVNSELFPNLGKGKGRLKNQKTSGDHPDSSIIKIGQNTKKSLRDLRKLAVIQDPVTKASANADVKTLKSKIIIIIIIMGL